MRRSELADPADLGSFQPSFNRIRQSTASPCFCADGHVSDPSTGDVLVPQKKTVMNLKTAGIQALRVQMHSELIASMHWSEKVSAAVDHRERHLWPALLAAATGKNSMGFSPEPFQAVFPGFVAPAQELMKMHHTCGVGVTETHCFRKLQPAGGVSDQRIP